MFRRMIAALLVLLALSAAGDVYGKGQDGGADCPPGSKDPDCAK